MITNLYADGFKSLKKFELRLQKGLNVLIGPNGAGKSNICQALGMVAFAAEGNLSDYILSLGGASSTFTITSPSKNKSRNNIKNLNISCKGDTRFQHKKDNWISLRYQYEFKLVLDEVLRISEETLIIDKLFSNGKWRRVLSASRKESKRIIIKIHEKLAGPMSVRLFGKKKKFEFPGNEDRLDSFFSALSSLFYYCYMVQQDMRFSKAWNIEPYLAKKSSDILEPLNMLQDGRGLSNAIHSMLKTGGKKLEEINEFMSRVLPRFAKINPEISEDTLTRTFSVTDIDGVKCPANSLSDGNVKLIALLVGVLSRKRSTSIIEEPENYLHPWAAQYLVEYFREHFSNGVCVITM